MSTDIVALAVLAAGAYALAKNSGSGLAAQSNELAPAGRTQGASDPDYAQTIVASTGIPPSTDNVTPGVLPSGQIRTLPPATPTEVSQLTSNPALQPVVIDGNWTNATNGTAESIQNRIQIARGQAHWRPEILPAPTAAMLQATREGNHIENDILPAAAAERFDRGGTSAFVGYRLKVGEWNHYRLRYDPSLDITAQQLDDTVDAEGYWQIVARSPVKSWLIGSLQGLNPPALGRLSRANSWAT